MNDAVELIVTDFLWVAAVVGWIILIVSGLEADKPLSGGIPGHLEVHDHQRTGVDWNARDKLGEIGGWVFFGSVAALLPAILFWIFMVHPR